MADEFVIFDKITYPVTDGILNLSEKGIKSIGEIKGLKRIETLRELNLSGNNIGEIKDLEDLIGLEKLYLDFNRITHISGLETLVNLKYLALGDNQISALGGLDNLTDLVDLQLNSNKISQINGLDSVTNLRELNLAFNHVISITGLEGHPHFEILSLNNNQLSEISGLETLTRLRKLELGSNNIKTITGLDTLADLQYLDLSSNSISEITGLENLVNVAKLRLRNNPIPGEFVEMLGGLDGQGYARNPSAFIRYCKVQKEKEVLEGMIRESKHLQQVVAEKMELQETFFSDVDRLKEELNELNASLVDAEASNDRATVQALDDIIRESRGKLRNLAGKMDENLASIAGDIEKVFILHENAEPIIQRMFGADWEKLGEKWNEYKSDECTLKEFLALVFNDEDRSMVKTFSKAFEGIVNDFSAKKSSPV
jgi:hypothetical protein